MLKRQVSLRDFWRYHAALYTEVVRKKEEQKERNDSGLLEMWKNRGNHLACFEIDLCVLHVPLALFQVLDLFNS